MKTSVELFEKNYENGITDYVYIYREERKDKVDKNNTHQLYVVSVVIRHFDDGLESVLSTYNMISGKTIRKEKREKIEEIVLKHHQFETLKAEKESGKLTQADLFLKTVYNMTVAREIEKCTPEQLERMQSRLDKYEILKISHRFETQEEFLESDAMKEVFEGFQGLQNEKNVLKRFEFLGAFMVSRDPKENYGRSFDLYHHYKTSDGLELIKTIETYGCISDSPLRQVIVFDDSVLLTPDYYRKDGEYRKLLAESHSCYM